MSLEKDLVKSALFLEKLKPKSLEVIIKNLEIATENILSVISTTNNQRQIRATIKKEVTNAFKDLDNLILEDIENVTGVAWNSTGAILTTYLSKDIAKRFIKFDNLDDIIKKQLLNPKQLILGNNLDDFKGNFIHSANSKLRGAILQGLENKVGIDEVRRNITHILGNIGHNQVKTVARTAMLSAINQAKEKQYMQMLEGMDVIYEYSAVLDNRVSLYCLTANHYTTKDISKAKYQVNSHYNCRSLWIPTTKEIREYEKKNPETARIVQWDTSKKVHHKDGTTSTKFIQDSVKIVKNNPTPQQFFNSLDENFKSDYMGKRRYKLYKDNNLKFDDMLKQSRSEFLSIDELNGLLRIK